MSNMHQVVFDKELGTVTEYEFDDEWDRSQSESHSDGSWIYSISHNVWGIYQADKKGWFQVSETQIPARHRAYALLLGKS